MTVASIVRTARATDHQEVWRMLLQSWRENGQFTLNPAKVDYLVCRLLAPETIPAWDCGPRGVIGVIGESTALEALAILVISDYWYTDDKHLGEMLVYVDPECRRTFHARALIKWMKQQSDQTRMPLVTGVISNERTASKVALYARMVPKVGEFFLYRGGNQTGSVAQSSAAAA